MNPKLAERRKLSYGAEIKIAIQVFHCDISMYICIIAQTGSVWEIGTSGRGEDTRKGCRRVNMIEMLCTHV
jgi:hypothetical protein